MANNLEPSGTPEIINSPAQPLRERDKRRISPIPPRKERKPSERNLKLLEMYKSGTPIKTIAQEFSITETRVFQIVKRYEHLLAIDREAEKARRLRRLKLAEANAEDYLAPKDVRELVAVIEAQRKELEDNQPSSVTNITNNTLNLTQTEINNLTVEQKWDKLRGLIDQ